MPGTCCIPMRIGMEADPACTGPSLTWILNCVTNFLMVCIFVKRDLAYVVTAAMYYITAIYVVSYPDPP